ncbi:TrkA C-terminal domain-containing protein [Candidatus Acetothermia bacterium]|nr:TrkA C-terminal domain-containing protein [Candidatus Acetothermia bacterium]
MVNHPVRRRIITWLMILGNAGIVTVIVTITSSFVITTGYQLPITILVLLAGIYLIYKVATHRGLTRRWESFIEDKLVQSRVFEEGATEDLLHLLEGYSLVRAIIKGDSPLITKSLSDCKLNEKGLLVLGIERGKHWVPIPKAKETLEEGDRVIVYGRLDVLRSLF